MIDGASKLIETFAKYPSESIGFCIFCIILGLIGGVTLTTITNSLSRAVRRR